MGRLHAGTSLAPAPPPSRASSAAVYSWKQPCHSKPLALTRPASCFRHAILPVVVVILSPSLVVGAFQRKPSTRCPSAARRLKSYLTCTHAACAVPRTCMYGTSESCKVALSPSRLPQSQRPPGLPKKTGPIFAGSGARLPASISLG